jgi:transglutaminase-like putative cysteine protease
VRLSIRHKTHYAFSDPVYYGLQRLRLTPKPTHGQHVLDWTMEFQGARLEAEYDDHQHNRTTLISVEPGTRELSVTCTGTVDTADKSGVIGQHAGFTPLWLFLRPTPLTRPGPQLRALVASVQAHRGNALEMLHALSQAIHGAVAYEVGTTTVETTAETSLESGRGVCQDHAHVFIGAARMLDIPARYVSGYLKMDEKIEQQAGHGWAEAYIEGLGWVGFDVSNEISPDERYVRVATGCDYADAAPVAGLSLGQGNSALRVELAVEQQQQGDQ